MREVIEEYDCLGAEKRAKLIVRDAVHSHDRAGLELTEPTKMIEISVEQNGVVNEIDISCDFAKRIAR